MAYNVSSEYYSRMAEPFADVGREFTINGSDYSANVVRWPKFDRAWDEIRPKTLAIELTNGEQEFNFLRTNPTLLTSSCEVSMGPQVWDELSTESGEIILTEAGDPLQVRIYEEFLTVFTGVMEKSVFKDGRCTITINDKFKQLSERVIGDTENPVDYTTSNYLPSDLAWFICTSHAGYDATQSSSNTDIDWDAFQDWASVFSGDNVLVNAYFDGQNANTALRKIARLSQSAMYIKDNKISFHRFSLADSAQTEFNNSNIKNLMAEVNDRDIINRQIIYGAYDVTSDSYSISVLEQNSSSVNSFGLRENVEKDEVVWYVDSPSCLNYAQRILDTSAIPYDKVEVETSLLGLDRQVGETITVVDSLIGLNDSFRIMNFMLDMDKGSIRFKAERSQLLSAFILDVSQLDGTDVLI